jgi:type IV secretion system protein VirB4
MMPLTLAAGGRHYNIGQTGRPLSFCPLHQLETPSDIAWAEEWIASCYELQAGGRPSVEQNHEIHRAVKLLCAAPPAARSLTEFIATVQDQKIRAAIGHYTVDGALGHLLDGREDGLVDNTFQVFELEELLSLGNANVLPVLLYLFRRFEKALAGQPALLILDEAWLLLSHPVFRAKIVEWLKVLRRANCAVVLATQSLSDAVKSGIMDVLQESCATKILLPNEEADKRGAETFAGPRDLYLTVGLNDTQIDIVKHAVKKRHYYALSSEGRRLIELGLGPVALAFTGVSDREALARVSAMAEAYGESWPYEWLKERKVNYEKYL